MTNTANPATYNALRNTLGFKSVGSVRDYVGFLEEAYLIFEIFRYDFSLKKQYVSEKKLYCIDTGLRNAVAFRFSDDKGRLLENVILIESVAPEQVCLFFQKSQRVRFYYGRAGEDHGAIQVCFELTKENRERELAGLSVAMTVHGLDEGIVLTYLQEETIREGDAVIRVVPAWKWLVGDRDGR